MLDDGDIAELLGPKEEHAAPPEGLLDSGGFEDVALKTVDHQSQSDDLTDLTEDEDSSQDSKKRLRSTNTNPFEEAAHGAPPLKRKRSYPKLTLPRDKSLATKFLSARLKPIKKAMMLIETTFTGGATCFFYCKPKYGDARQIVSTNICPVSLNTNMKHSVFINFLDSLSHVTTPVRNVPFEPETLHWDTVLALLIDVDMSCLKKTIRRIAHLIDGFQNHSL